MRKPVTVGVVQLNQGKYTYLRELRSELSALIEPLVENGAKLVVLPAYTGLFLYQAVGQTVGILKPSPFPRSKDKEEGAEASSADEVSGADEEAGTDEETGSDESNRSDESKGPNGADSPDESISSDEGVSIDEADTRDEANGRDEGVGSDGMNVRDEADLPVEADEADGSFADEEKIMSADEENTPSENEAKDLTAEDPPAKDLPTEDPPTENLSTAEANNPSTIGNMSASIGDNNSTALTNRRISAVQSGLTDARIDGFSFSPGFFQRIRELALEFEATYSELIGGLAREYRIYIAGATIFHIDESSGSIFHSASLFDPYGSFLGIQTQTHVDTDESDLGVRGGNSIEIFETEIGKIGFCIGTDCRYPEVGRILALNGAEIIISPVAYERPYNPWRRFAGPWRNAQLNRVFVIESCLVGTLGERRYEGKSSILAPCELTPDGSGILTEIDYIDKPGCALTSLDLDALEDLKEFSYLPESENTAVYRKYFNSIYKKTGEAEKN